MTPTDAIGRRKHFWKLRSDGFRDLLIKHRWRLKGAYGEKCIRGVTVMMTTVKRSPGYFVICVQPKDRFWAEITAGAETAEVVSRAREQARRTAARIASAQTEARAAARLLTAQGIPLAEALTKVRGQVRRAFGDVPFSVVDVAVSLAYAEYHAAASECGDADRGAPPPDRRG